MLSLVTVVLSLFSFAVNGQTYHDIRSINPASGVKEAKQTFELRKNRLTQYWAAGRLLKFPFHDSFKDKALSTIAIATAKLLLGKDIESVNDYLLDERFQPGLSGTRIKLFGGLCKRYGDYDFVLQELIRVAYFDEGQLSPEARQRLLDELLNQKGSEHYSQFNLGVCGKHEDTENHILMTEAARYLTNQLLFKRDGQAEYDNEANGFNDWLVDHLRYFYVHGFSEMNSKPYAGYTISALLNLYDFAENNKVKNAAKTLLDYLTMRYAMESLDLRRYPTFRRQKKHYNNEWLHHKDSMTAMMMALSGNYHYLYKSEVSFEGLLPYGDRFAFNAAVSSYFPEEIVLDHIFNPKKSMNFASLEHKGKSVSYMEEDFLISGGGVHRRLFPPFTIVNDVLAAPTLLIPRNKGDNLNDLFYFKGKKRPGARSNLCVAENFMCGFDLHVPKDINPGCFFSQGDWTFYDFSKEDCNSVYKNLYLAVYKNSAGRNAPAENYGFIEVRKAQTGFHAFVDSVASNAKPFYHYEVEEDYETSEGKRIKFQIDAGKGNYEILNGQAGSNSKKWQRVSGKYHSLNGRKMVISNESSRLIYTWDAGELTIRKETK